MYAVIETGGKQYRVELGTEIEIDRLEAALGETIELGRVLLLADGDEAQIGRPIVEGATVSAAVVRQDRGEKIIVFKYKPKARRRVKHGHRQDLTIVRVSDIVFNGRSAAKEAQVEARELEAVRKAATEEAERKAAADRELAAKLEREAKAAADKAAAEEKKAEAKPARARKTAPAKAGSDEKARPDDKAAAKATTKAKATTTKAKAADKAQAADKADDADKAEAKPASRRKPTTKKDE
jgi:large subunit ribosomal protein L21